MSGAKELGLCVLLWCLQLITQLNRFLALQALVEGLGIWRATLGLKFPILLNWVKSQITREAKEAIHIRWLDPSLNRNIGKMSIPHCFDHLLGAKPKHPQVGALAAPLPVDEIAPPSQILGLNLTQFNNIGNFRPNVALHIPRPSTRACRAKNLFN